MFKFALFIILFGGNTEKRQVDTIIEWSEGQKLNYADFEGTRSGLKDSLPKFDTLAVINTSIDYKIEIGSGKRPIQAFAIMDPKKSWMVVKVPEILRHEQGHFDISEIYARRFEKMINDTIISDARGYFAFLTDSFKEVMDDMKEEQDKYDAWTKNTPGQEFYYKWIGEQLLLPKEGRGAGRQPDNQNTLSFILVINASRNFSLMGICLPPIKTWLSRIESRRTMLTI
jgi:hypothetical protein